MPELPEVQTTIDGLNKKIRQRRIISTWNDWPKFSPVEKTQGHTIKKIERIGKNILFYFTDPHILLVHMKMTGHLLVGEWKIGRGGVIPIKPKEMKERINGFIHFILVLDDGKMVAFSDVRKFGKVVFGTLDEIENLPELKKIGPDALKISLKDFSERVLKKKKTIYQTLLDQDVVAGIGNIYVSEILWQVKVHPLTPANKLNKDQLKEMCKATKQILSKAVKFRGTSVDDYRDASGKRGGYADHRLAYGREGEGCKRCEVKMKRAKKGGRSFHYCPDCQKLN